MQKTAISLRIARTALARQGARAIPGLKGETWGTRSWWLSEGR